MTGSYNVLAHNDKYIINVGNTIYAFNSTTGESVASYASVGKANNEYIQNSQMWIKDELLHIFDWQSSKVLIFDLSGKHIETLMLSKSFKDNRFSKIIPFNDRYVGIRTFAGGVPEVAEVAFYNKDYLFEKDIDLGIKRSSIGLHMPLAKGSNGDMLYNRYFMPEIHSIDTIGNTAVKYYIDFLENSIPASSFKDELEIINHLSNNEDRYAGLISNIYESERYLCFTYLYQGSVIVFIYDRNSGKSKQLELVNGILSLKSTQFYDDKLLLFIENENSTGILPFNIETV